MTNHVLTKGFDFFQVLPETLPNNLLLLNHSDATSRFDDYTRFQLIMGQSQVAQYFNRQKHNKEAQIQWIDYHSLYLLHQLQPSEIAELLYIGHAHHPLKSAFYYKLQNAFVYLALPNDFTKIYYRTLPVFYQQFCEWLAKRVQSQLGNRPGNFMLKKRLIKYEVITPSQDFILDLSECFLEGVLFDFNQLQIQNQNVIIPLYLAEDHVDSTWNNLKQAKQLAVVQYDLKTHEWKVK